jgi:hypothetical protein
MCCATEKMWLFKITPFIIVYMLNRSIEQLDGLEVFIDQGRSYRAKAFKHLKFELA